MAQREDVKGHGYITFDDDSPAPLRLRLIAERLRRKDPRNFLFSLSCRTAALPQGVGPLDRRSPGDIPLAPGTSYFFRHEDLYDITQAAVLDDDIRHRALLVTALVVQLLQKWVDADPESHTRRKLFQALCDVGMLDLGCAFLQGTRLRLTLPRECWLICANVTCCS